jgi:quinol-cytochrome oxidoreductase complex cytochrome b subunit
VSITLSWQSWFLINGHQMPPWKFLAYYRMTTMSPTDDDYRSGLFKRIFKVFISYVKVKEESRSTHCSPFFLKKLIAS